MYVIQLINEKMIMNREETKLKILFGILFIIITITTTIPILINYKIISDNG